MSGTRKAARPKHWISPSAIEAPTQPVQLRVGRADGSQWQTFGLASDPVWSPDSQRLAFVQWPPRSDSNLAAKVSLLDINTWSANPVDLPDGSIPSQWLGK